MGLDAQRSKHALPCAQHPGPMITLETEDNWSRHYHKSKVKDLANVADVSSGFYIRWIIWLLFWFLDFLYWCMSSCKVIFQFKPKKRPNDHCFFFISRKPWKLHFFGVFRSKWQNVIYYYQKWFEDFYSSLTIETYMEKGSKLCGGLIFDHQTTKCIKSWILRQFSRFVGNYFDTIKGRFGYL